jgi:hypothetical protein
MSTPDEVAVLLAEVVALRKRVQVLTVLSLIILAAALVLAVLGWTTGSGRWATAENRAVEVSAQEYRLLDPDGNLRGIWQCPPAGPSLILLDEQGRLAVEVAQRPGKGGSILVKDADGRVLFKQP